MMENLGVRYSELIKVRSATLPKGQYVKLRPQSKTFLDIANPKVLVLDQQRICTIRCYMALVIDRIVQAVLENTLRSFSALTKGK